MIQKKGAQMVRSLLGGLALAAMHVGALAQGATALIGHLFGVATA